MRARLVALIAVAIVPLVGLAAAAISFDYNESLSKARQDVMAGAEMAAQRQSLAFSNARVFLDTLRHTPGIQANAGGACANIMARVKAANPQINTIGVVNASGIVTCHTHMTSHNPYGNKLLFERMKTASKDAFVVSDFMVGSYTGLPTMVAAMPLVPGPDGKFGGLIFMGMNLEDLMVTTGPVSAAGQSLVMLDPRTGNFAAQYSSFPEGFTRLLPGHPLLTAALESGGHGVAEARGPDGQERIYGFSSIAAAESAGIVLAVGVSRDDVVSPVRLRAQLAMALSAAVIALIVWTTWWFGFFMQVLPVRQLTAAANRIGAGNFDTRSRIGPWQAPEFRELASVLDDMAIKLTAARRGEIALAAREAQYRLLAENSFDLVTCLDANGMRVFASPASRELLGLEPHELLGGRPEDIAFEDDMPQVKAMMRALADGAWISGVQYRVRHRAGHLVWVEVTGKPLDDGRGTVFVIRDISRRKTIEANLEEANKRLKLLAATDGLTGLMNRRAFDETFAREFRRCVREADNLSLVLIDVDHFKDFNDVYGHQAGDDCLRKISLAFAAKLQRPADVGARYGGEELVALLPNTPLSGALETADAIRRAVRALGLVHTGSNFGVVTISLGIATLHSGKGFANCAEMLRAADLALYRAKAEGRDTVCIRSADDTDAIGATSSAA
ncbi:diguanylate cyclase [Aureimonas sp. SA4125]|uniref:diguanylate cyclase n=1 Tax=Aureimonas sp. SA4125 TaxID=2826993 RepID=UPI001CC69B8E|nr:diguanylate cyclase [Aureimonas sp. SA4125]